MKKSDGGEDEKALEEGSGGGGNSDSFPFSNDLVGGGTENCDQDTRVVAVSMKPCMKVSKPEKPRKRT